MICIAIATILLVRDLKSRDLTFKGGLVFAAVSDLPVQDNCVTLVAGLIDGNAV